MASRLKQTWERYYAIWTREGYHIVLALQFLLFVLQPWARASVFGGEQLVSFLYLAIFVGSFLTLAESRAALVLGAILGTPGIVLFFWHSREHDTTTAFGSIFTAAFLFLLAGMIVVNVYKSDKVTGVTLSGSLCVYMLLGTAWGLLYNALDLLEAGTSFTGVVEGADAEQRLFYFSYVTLTTLGYGDISPVSPIARMLAMLEAIVGQLYLVVMVARLVGLHIAHRDAEA